MQFISFRVCKLSAKPEFIDAAKAGNVLARKCVKCGELHLATVYFCKKCGSNGFSNSILKGTGATAAQNGETKLNGSISINPSGGLKSKGHPIGATGVGQIVEVFEQLTGQSGERTVNDAKIGLTQNFGATGASCAVHVFQSV